MFTGLIEEIGIVQDIKITSQGAKIRFFATFDDVSDGDSIAINGVCLTIKNISKNIFEADVMKETLNKTNIKILKTNDKINLERAMLLTQRLDGHIVQGHIDCCAKVISILEDGFSKKITFECNSELIINKGSIAINGVSLTVSKVQNNSFEISLIPTTLEKTNLKNLKNGDIVNIEYDIIGKYIYKFTKKDTESRITKEFLEKYGF